MNYSMGEIPPAEVLRLLLKHGVLRIPVAAIHELFNVVKPHLSFFEKSAVSLLISTFYKEDLAALLKMWKNGLPCERFLNHSCMTIGSQLFYENI